MNDSLWDRLLSLVKGILFFISLLILLWFVGVDIYYEIIHIDAILNFKFCFIIFLKVIISLLLFFYFIKKSLLIIFASLFKIFVIFGWIILDKQSLYKLNYYCTEILEKDVDTDDGSDKGFRYK